MEEAVAEFSWTEEELQTAFRLSFPRRIIVLSTVSGCTMVLAGAVVALLGYWEGVVFIVLGLFNAIYIHWLPRIVSRKAWNVTRGLNGQQRITISEAGVVTEAPGLQTTRAWSRIPFVVELGEFYFLRLQATARGTPIPRRAFLSARDEANFRTLCRANAMPTFLSHPELDG
jgi:hypothetical protein